MATPAHPPKPGFAFSVGVIGHRPNRLPEESRTQVETDIGAILAAIRAEALAAYARHATHFSDSPPRLTLVTALAEGADRMAARAALKIGFALETPLPFPATEYEKDFEQPDARTAFRDYLRQSRVVLELDGDRAQAGRSYAANGIVVLDNSDMLIAVWDGGAALGRGGTAELVHEAARRGMPVVRIDVTGHDPPKLQWRGLGDSHVAPMHIDDQPSAALENALARVIEAEVQVPRGRSERQGLERYLSERRRRFTVRLEYPLLMAILGVRWPRFSDAILPDPGFERAGGDEESRSVLMRAFNWADAIAVRFAQDFRSAVVANFLIAAVAILLAVLSFRFPWSAMELVLVFLLVVNAFVGHKRRWHHRWIESREVAERLRVAEPMRMLATRALGPFGAAATWPAWYVRALSREAGLRGGTMDVDARRSAQRSMLILVAEQAKYHSETVQRFQRIHKRLTLAGQLLFAAALLLSAAMFVVNWFQIFTVTAQLNHWLIVASASLPAFGSASYGIRVIGDFDGAAKRSARMRDDLLSLAESIAQGGSAPEWLRDRAHKAADVMLGDVANWRLAVESRELDMPG